MRVRASVEISQLLRSFTLCAFRWNSHFRSYFSAQDSVTIDDVCLKVQPPKPCFCLDQSISPPDHLFILASQASQPVLFKGQIPKPCSSLFSLMDEHTRDGVCGTSNKPFCGILFLKFVVGVRKCLSVRVFVENLLSLLSFTLCAF